MGMCGGQFHVSQHHGILNFVVVNEIVHGALAADELLPIQQVGEDFQKVRFTTAEEAGDPDAGFGGLSHDPLFVVVEKFAEVLGQFAGDNVFFQFLLGVAVLAFANNDNALDVTVNGFLNISLINMETSSLRFYKPKRAVVVVIFQFIK